MSLIKTWAPHFQSSIRMRGRAYQAAGRVKRLPTEEGELVRAQVMGKRPYTVVIRGQGSTASVQCTCPFFAGGSYCKHIWATILDVQRSTLDAPEDATQPAVADDEPNLRPPKARRRNLDEKKPRNGEPEWIGRLSLLRSAVIADGVPGIAGAASFPTMRGQVCYAVSPMLSGRHNTLIIRLRQRDPTQTGWSRLKRLKMVAGQVEQLPDPIDRELCSLILAAPMVPDDEMPLRYGGEAAYGAYRIPRGAAGAMLKRMIQTGRCFVEEDEGGDAYPMTWSDDTLWTLWMVGVVAGDELLVTTQLRSGEEKLPIDRPRLILGGSDGLVIHDTQAAPFDDRGATRWVSQFRDDYRLGDRATPIRVPLQDVPRFLDRLYGLTHLPELDLPPGIGRQERRVAPVVHLEISSPDTKDPTLGAAPPRSQLVARFWFAYDEDRVRPGQPGRYVQPDKPRPVRDTDTDTAAEELVDGETHELIDQDPPEDAEDPGNDQPFDVTLIRRDMVQEQEAAAILSTLGFREHPGALGNPDTLLLAARQMPTAVAALLGRGWIITADQHVIRQAGPPRLSIASGIDWFELHGSVQFQTATGEESVSLPDVLAALQAGKKMIRLGDGSEGLLPEEWLQRQGLLAAMGKVHGDHIRFKQSQAALLDTLLEQQELTSVDAKFEAARERLRQFDGIKPIQPAVTFQGTLRSYQCEGLGWLAFLRWFGMGGVLADDMGLGKTIQVLAMFDARYNGENREETVAEGGVDATENAGDKKSETHRPSLIVVPRSVVFNWIDEAARFAPKLRVQAYAGADRETLREAFRDHDVIVTSYGLMRRDIAELSKHSFDYVVLDEAQAIKNPASQSAKAARLLEGNHRLALSGTPLENHLGDLWSIFEFLNPGMLGSSTRFGLLVRGDTGNGGGNGKSNGNGEEVAAGNNGGNGKANHENGDADGTAEARPSLDSHAVAQIAKALRPFILRRTKSRVLSELPEKTEQTIVCQLEPEQRKLYEQLRQHYRGRLLGGRDAGIATGGGNGGSGGGTMMVLEALLRLRQAACHPGLIDPKRGDEPSAKLEVLMDRLADLIEEGHKALVFSQFTSMLALVRRRLDAKGIVYEYLDGQTRHRKKHVQRFQTDPDCPLFLISLKAGGLGLNLTAAEYVFILDPWWNPAVEAQAIDRIHRIGQTRHVFAYRLICEDTVEQRIADLQAKKKKLADAIVGGQESVLSSLSREDLDQLLS